MTCRCAVVQHNQAVPLVEAFSQLRLGCVPLKQLLAPDDVWRAIAADAASPNTALHRSYLLLAFERGHLATITQPVHRFLCEDAGLRPSLMDQYRRDLREHWLLEQDEVRRHERFRRFLGKVVEIQVAAWLADRGWNVTGLEALGAKSDILGESPDGAEYGIEVKYIGQSTEDFQDVVKALAGLPAGGGKSLYGAINYLLFRAYEAARGLRERTGAKLAIIVVDAQSWYSFDYPLKYSWLDWQAPAFLPTEETDWNRFHKGLREGDPGIDQDVATLVKELQQVWVVRLNGGYEYSLEYEYRPAG